MRIFASDNTQANREYGSGKWQAGIEYPDGDITCLDCRAFIAEPISAISLPPRLESIGPEAFAFCTRLEEIVIPGTVTDIPESAFYCCENLKRVVFEAPPASIGRFAFAGCYALTEFVVAGVSRSLEDMIALDGAQPYAFFGCGGDIREPLPEADPPNTELHEATPRYFSAYYYQQSAFCGDIQWGMNYTKHWQRRGWNRQDPEQFRWMPGISREALQQWLEASRLQLPEEYEAVLLKTNGAELFRQRMTLYSVPTENENDWQWEHSLEWLNSTQNREKCGIPQELYLLGCVAEGIWFGVVQRDGQPKIAEFNLREKHLQVYGEYGRWRERLYKFYQFNPDYWETEDRLYALQEELYSMGPPDVYTTSLWQIRERAGKRT